MLKIRLQRTGRKNDPSFRVVVTEHTRGPKSEKHVDRVGFYNPKTKEQKLEADRITSWIEKGAQASGTVHNMLIKAGIVKGDTINVLPQKSPVAMDKETNGGEVTARENEGEEAHTETAGEEQDSEEKREGEEAVSEDAPAAGEKEAQEAAPAEGTVAVEAEEHTTAEVPVAEEEKKEE